VRRSTRDAWRGTELVAEREVKVALGRRSFWIVVALLAVGSTAAMVLPGLLDRGGTTYDVGVVNPPRTGEFESRLTAASRELDATVDFRTIDRRATARRLVDDGEIDEAVVFTDPPFVVVRSGEDDALVAATRQALVATTLAARLDAAGLDPAQVDAVLELPAARVQETDADEGDRVAAVVVLSLVLYLALLMLTIQAASGTAIEKSNRISEVLLAIVRPGALLFGKVVGVSLVGLASLSAAALPVVVKVVVGGDLPPGLGDALLGGAPWFALGLALYLVVAGALGSLVERQEETGTVIAPLSFVLVAAYLLAQVAAGTTFGSVLAIFPLSSPLVMPARIALGEATTPEIVVSLVVLVASLLFVIRVGAAMYRRGIVHTGRRLTIREALRTT
jgi:ABC-2 type transport system permease protein